jgi:small-conductance mechanosensitive channel
LPKKPDNSATEEKPRPRRRLRRWLLCLVIAALALVFVLLGALWYASLHLADIARWGMRRAFPHVILDVESLNIVSLRRIEATRIVLKSRRDGATLLTLDKGIADFDLDDLPRKRLGSIRLINPHIAITPVLFGAFASEESSSSGGFSSGFAWNISRLVTER